MNTITTMKPSKGIGVEPVEYPTLDRLENMPRCRVPVECVLYFRKLGFRHHPLIEPNESGVFLFLEVE